MPVALLRERQEAGYCGYRTVCLGDLERKSEVLGEKGNHGYKSLSDYS